MRKSVHINLTKSTHSEFRVLLFKKGLSMQEVFEELAVKIVEGDDHLSNILNEIEYNKKVGNATRKISATDTDSIFEAIEEENPLGDS